VARKAPRTLATAKFSALKLSRLVTPGRYCDGGGLWLQVRDADHRSWLYRYKLYGRARQMGLGSLHDVSLAEARELARQARKLVHQSVDPIDRRRTARGEVAGTLTFREVADRYLAAPEMAWRNAKHRYQRRATLNTACAVFGSFPVSQVDTGAVMRVLEPMWHRKPETASRLRGRIEAVLDYATAPGWRTGANPARWRGHLKNLLPATSRIARVEHHAALPWAEIGAFMAALKAQKGVGGQGTRIHYSSRGAHRGSAGSQVAGDKLGEQAADRTR
jgi:hypothetical protein